MSKICKQCNEPYYGKECSCMADRVDCYNYKRTCNGYNCRDCNNTITLMDHQQNMRDQYNKVVDITPERLAKSLLQLKANDLPYFKLLRSKLEIYEPELLEKARRCLK